MPTRTSRSSSTKDYYHGVYNQLMRFPAEQALYAALYARRTLEAGFTTVRNVGADDFVDIGLRNAINAGRDRRSAHPHRRARHRLPRRALR